MKLYFTCAVTYLVTLVMLEFDEDGGETMARQLKRGVNWVFKNYKTLK